MLYRRCFRTDGKSLGFDHMPVNVRGIYCGQRGIGFAPRSSVFPPSGLVHRCSTLYFMHEYLLSSTISVTQSVFNPYPANVEYRMSS